MIAKTVCQKAQADHQQKAKAEHNDCGVTLHKFQQGRCRQHHNDHGRNHGQHHDEHMVNHAHRSDDGIEREHGVENNDLKNHLPVANPGALGIEPARVALEPVVQLHGALEQQKHAARHEYEIAGRIAVPAQGEQGVCEQNKPCHKGQQNHAHEQGKAKAGHECLALPLLRQFAHKNGYEHQVIHAKHHLKQYQRAQTGPGRGVSYPCQIPHILSCGHAACV